jgi:hypothetical protein
LFNPVAAAAAARLYAMVLDLAAFVGGAQRCNGLVNTSLVFPRIGMDCVLTSDVLAMAINNTSRQPPPLTHFHAGVRRSCHQRTPSSGATTSRSDAVRVAERVGRLRELCSFGFGYYASLNGRPSWASEERECSNFDAAALAPHIDLNQRRRRDMRLAPRPDHVRVLRRFS